MELKVEDLEDKTRFRNILTLQYQDLISFVFDNLKKKTVLTIFFWSVCVCFLGIAIYVRINISGYFPALNIIIHSFLGLVILPLVSIPVHELLHIIPYYISGARNIRVGMDLKQYLFYVTAHRYVATPLQFRIVALAPFLLISLTTCMLVFLNPGLWKWSLSLFLFVHATMCAGDFALLNFYLLNDKKKIYTWDDADRKVAYFYEKLEQF